MCRRGLSVPLRRSCAEVVPCPRLPRCTQNVQPVTVYSPMVHLRTTTLVKRMTANSVVCGVDMAAAGASPSQEPVVVGIDFGTTGVGWGYAFRANPVVYVDDRWAGVALEPTRKVVNAILLDRRTHNVLAFGEVARSQYVDTMEQDRESNAGPLYFERVGGREVAGGGRGVAPAPHTLCPLVPMYTCLRSVQFKMVLQTIPDDGIGTLNVRVRAERAIA
jgi:hypothetical protein